MAVLASGPSMSGAVADQVRAAGVPAIAINNTHRLAPWAWLLHAADSAWWLHESNRDAEAFPGIRTTMEDVRGVIKLERTGTSGFDPTPGQIRTGKNSGYQGVHIAAQTGAARILLCGFDMQHTGGERHWHGNHATGLKDTDPDAYPHWVAYFDGLAKALPSRIINCTPGSAIKCFPSMTLEAALATP